jgi:hypothetical protein
MLFPVGDAGLDAGDQLLERLELVPGRRRVAHGAIGEETGENGVLELRKGEVGGAGKVEGGFQLEVLATEAVDLF